MNILMNVLHQKHRHIFLSLRDALNENQAYLDCPENWQYEPINRQWPATPEMCAQMYQRAKPLIRKETVYNLTVEDNHTYVVEHNGMTLWTHNACKWDDLIN